MTPEGFLSDDDKRESYYPNAEGHFEKPSEAQERGFLCHPLYDRSNKENALLLTQLWNIYSSILRAEI